MLRRLGNAEASIDPTWFIWDICPWLIETIPAVQHDPHRVEDVLKVDADPEGKNGDDPYDSARYGLMAEGSRGGDGPLLIAYGRFTPERIRDWALAFFAITTVERFAKSLYMTRGQNEIRQTPIRDFQ